MSDGGASQDEMGRFLRLRDRELNRLLAGRTLADNGDLDELATFVRELTHTFQAAPDPATETRHLNAIIDALRALPAADTAPMAATDGSASLARRSRWLAGRSWAARLVLAGVLTFGLFCGVAYAGALPGPVQGAVADVARNVGVSLPGAHNDKDDGAQNDKQDGQPSIVPGQTQTDTNGRAETNGVQDDESRLRQNDGEQGSQSDDRDSSQQHGNSGTQNRGNDDGTNGNSGGEGRSESGQGAHGNVGATPGVGQGGGNQGGGNQGGVHADGSRAMATRATATIEVFPARPRRRQGS